jgi:hypothetical protein
LQHDALGYALFAGALVMIWSTNKLIMFLTPFSNKDEDDVPAHSSRTDGLDLASALSQSWLNSWGVGIAFAVLLGLYFAANGMPKFATTGSTATLNANIAKLNDDSMPTKLDGWKRDEKMKSDTRPAYSEFGEFFKEWHYSGDGTRAVVQLDYPFPHYHDLSACYYSQGWELEEAKNQKGDQPLAPANFTTQKMKKHGFRSGYLVHCQIDSTGQALAPPERNTAVATMNRQVGALKRLFGKEDSEKTAPQQVGSVYQFQLFVETLAPLTESEERQTQERFFQAYSLMQEQLFKAPKANAGNAP